MNARKIYILILALGLTMVWLGCLYTYELKVVQPKKEQVQLAAGEEIQVAGIQETPTSSVEEKEAGFPFILAGIGLAFVLGGAFRVRQAEEGE